ncbi:MAG: hypothetical protein ACTHMS_01605 [Jatrophihabitans sp.]|uniref:hypothetical protein n=1 Tax=Jatrophihabitans sp. TaxID=1932789 RepID=UPI003F7E985A
MTGYALDAKASRRKNNALALQVVDDTGAVATAVQSSADGRRTRTAVLMGWRNGGAGRHGVTFADGREQVVEVAGGAPTRVLDAGGAVVATITPGAPSEYRAADGAVVLHVQPDGPPTKGKLPMAVTRPDGSVLARAVDVRTNTEWSVRDALRDAGDLVMLVTGSGAGSLPMRRFGLQVTADAPPSTAERDALVAIAVAITIGLADLVPQFERTKRS